MSGRYSQQKGKREELLLCQALRAFGYTEVCRIAHWDRSKHNPDVQGMCPNTGLLTTFENKTRKSLPRWLSRLQSGPTLGVHHEVLRFSFGDSLVAFGTNPLKVQDTHNIIFEGCSDKVFEKKVKTLFKNLDGADFLVMKGSRGHRMFIKFWGVWDEKKVSTS